MGLEDPITAGPFVGQPQTYHDGEGCAAGGDHRRGDMRPRTRPADQGTAEGLGDDNTGGDRRGR